MSLVQCIQDQAEYYKSLESELNTESSIKHDLSVVSRERKILEKVIEQKQAEINNLEKNSKKEFNEARKMRHLSFRSAAATLSGKKKEKVAKEEAKYQLAFENEQRSKRELDILQSKYEVLMNKENELSSQTSHFKEAKLQMESLLEQIFQTEDPNFPSESHIKVELANYRDQRRLAKRDKNRFAEAETALSTSLVDTKKVIRLLDTVVNYVPFEIFGGPMIDQEQLAYLDAAKKRVWEIQRMLNIARTVLPEIPHPQTLDVVTNNPLLNMQVNFNYVDALWKAKTTQCFGMLATAYRNIQNSLTWVKQYHQYTIGAIIRLDEAVETTKNNLDAERRRIVQSVLAGYVSDRPVDGYSSNNDELPPPVYEAPPSESTHNEGSNNLSMPDIPHDLTPSTSFNNLPITNIPSPLIPEATLQVPNDPTLPPRPITPVVDHGHSTNPSVLNNSVQQPYVSHNTNNPFNNRT